MPNEPPERNGFRNALCIAVAFFFIFFGFGTAQQYLVLVLDRRGEGGLALISLFILYGMFMLASLAASRLIPLFGGLKRSLIVGTGTYAAFVASVAFENAALLLAASALIGIGASLLWISSAAIISDSSAPRDVGRNIGIQNIGLYCGSIFGLFAGNAMMALSVAHMYLALGAIAAFGIIPLLSVRPTQEQTQSRPFRLSFAFDPRMLALFPLLFGSYYLQGQMFTSMNVVIVEFLGVSAVPIVISLLKLGSMAGSYGSGVLAGRFDEVRLLLILASLMLFGSVLFATGSTFSALMIAAAMLGFSTISMYPVVLSMLKDTFAPDEYLYALGTFNLYNNIGVMTAIAAGSTLGASESFVPGALALTAALPCLAFFKKFARTSSGQVQAGS